MTDKYNVRLVNIPANQLTRAVRCARQYIEDHPDAIGTRYGAVYSREESDFAPIFVYRTAGGAIVCKLMRGETQ